MNKAIISAASLVLTAGLLSGLTRTAALWQEEHQVILQATKIVSNNGFMIEIGDQVISRTDNGTGTTRDLGSIDLNTSIPANAEDYIPTQGFAFRYRNNSGKTFSVTLSLPQGLSGTFWLQSAENTTCDFNSYADPKYYRWFGDGHNYDSIINTVRGTTGQTYEKTFCFKVSNRNLLPSNINMKVRG